MKHQHEAISATDFFLHRAKNPGGPNMGGDLRGEGGGRWWRWCELTRVHSIGKKQEKQGVTGNC